MNPHDGPMLVVTYAKAVLSALANFMPERSVIFIEEADVISRRNVRAATADSTTLREVIEFDIQADGAADRFYVQHAGLRPCAVVAISDYGVPFAARLAERYGVPGAGFGAAVLLRDKHLQREVTAAAGIPNPQSVEVHSPDDVRAFMAGLGGPIVLKPANRRAAVGTKIIHDPADIDASWRECLDQDEGRLAPGAPVPLRMLAERFVEGAEFSVEMLVSHGQSVFAGVTKKYLFEGPRPVELGHVHPADIDDELTRRLLADTGRVVAAVGMDTGIVHCEWIVEAGVPHLVECAGRPAGDGIIELAEMAWDYDVTLQYFTMMRGLPLTEKQLEHPVRYAAAWLPHAPVGTVERVDGVEAAGGLPGVHECAVSVAPGDEVHELRSSWDRVAMVIAEGGRAAEAVANAQRAVDHITITVRGRS
jgi:biotin carboxylase